MELKHDGIWGWGIYGLSTQISWDRGRYGQWVVRMHLTKLWTKLQHQAQLIKPLYVHAVGFSMGWVRGCVRIRALYFIHVYIYMKMGKDEVF